MLRTLVVLAALHGVASADFGEQLAFIPGPPDGLVVPLDAVTAEARSEMFTRAFAETQHPLVALQLRLARADLWAARAIQILVESPDLAHDMAATWARERAFEDYEIVVRSAPAGWPPLAGALARYAHVLELSREATAQQIYKRVVDELPASPYAVHARLAIGDHELRAGHVAEARAQFTVLAKPGVETKLRTYALYRLGWLELDGAGQGARAFALFEQANAFVHDGPLASELRHGMTKAYSLFGPPRDAFETFERLAGARAIDMAIELADRLEENNRFADAIAVRSQLVRRIPEDPRACRWQIDAARAAFKSKDDAQLLIEAERLAQLFARFRGDPDAVDECGAAIATYTLDVARVRTDPVLQQRLRDLFAQTFPDRRALAK